MPTIVRVSDGEAAGVGPLRFMHRLKTLMLPAGGRFHALRAWSVRGSNVSMGAENTSSAWPTWPAPTKLTCRRLVCGGRSYALVCEPQTIIFDEPTSALDMKNQTKTLGMISNLAVSGMSVIFTTHDPTHALYAADSTMLMGKEITVGDTSSQLTEDLLSSLYGTPIMTPSISFAGGSRRGVVPD